MNQAARGAGDAEHEDERLAVSAVVTADMLRRSILLEDSHVVEQLARSGSRSTSRRRRERRHERRS